MDSKVTSPTTYFGDKETPRGSNPEVDGNTSQLLPGKATKVYVRRYNHPGPAFRAPRPKALGPSVRSVLTHRRDRAEPGRSDFTLNKPKHTQSRVTGT